MEPHYISVVGGYPAGPAAVGAGKGAIVSLTSVAPIFAFVYATFVVLLVVLYSLLHQKWVWAEEEDSTAAPRESEVIRTLPDVDADEKSEEGERESLCAVRNSLSGDNAVRKSKSLAKFVETEQEFKVDDLRMCGYRESRLGIVCFFMTRLTTVFMAVWYIVIIVDQYNGCEVKGPDNLCFFGDYFILSTNEINGQVFFVWWVLDVCWNLFLYFYGSTLRNFFRIKSDFKSATYVCCTKRHEVVTMVKPTEILKRTRQLKKALLGDSATYHTTTVPVQHTSGGTSGLPEAATTSRYIEFMCTRYVYDDRQQIFQPATVSIPSTYGEIHKLRGLSSAEASQRLRTLGRNAIPFSVSSWPALIIEEFCTYLYLYQFTFYSVWGWFSAIIWGAPQMLVVFCSGVLNITITRANQAKIQSLTTYETKCTVLRDGGFAQVSSDELVPGDRLKITKGDWVLPCDLVIVSLTGESMPVRKSALPLDGAEDSDYDAEADAKHTLFAGTTVLQAGSSALEQDVVEAVVSETGIRTVKGDLISHILFPASMLFQYDEELAVVFGLLSVYALVVFIISILLQVAISPLFWVSTFAFAAFTVSQVLPPLLPVALVIGYTMAAKRLLSKQVLCVNPKRIVIAGKIKVFMFDKTGTLTKQGLDFLGVHKTNKTDQQQNTSAAPAFASDVLHSYNTSECKAGDKLSWALATCHAVTELRGADGETSLVGNQVEVKMFEACGWNLVERPTSGVRSEPSDEKLAIEKRFEFNHHTMTMSVLVRDQDGQVHVFVKGAPEKVAELCTSATKPADLEGVSRGHSLEGCYVIALSHRCLGPKTATEVAAMQRSDVEAAGSLGFLGLMLFRNELKPDSKAAIGAITEGGVRAVMVTGDNAQCGYYIARESGMALGGIYLSELLKDGTVMWRDMGKDVGEGTSGVGDGLLTTDEVLGACEDSLLLEKEKAPSKVNQASVAKSVDTPKPSSASAAGEGADGSLEADIGAVAGVRMKVELAITGKAMRRLEQQGRLDSLLLHTRIFARVKPDQKVAVIEKYIERGFITGMCGDGGNDCGALRAAHAGIALSEAEASVVSPFTSATKTTRSVVDLLCEGRCALTTSFSAYKFYIVYGLLWSMTKMLNFVYGVRMPITGYLSVDAVTAVLMAWAITLAQPLDHLLPYRPTTSLFFPQIVYSVLGQWVGWVLLLGGALALQAGVSGHVSYPADMTLALGYWELGDSWESTVFTCFMVLPLAWCGIVFSFGSKFRKSVFCNKAVWVVWLALFVTYSYLLLAPANDVTAFFHIGSNPFNGYATESPVWLRYQYPQGCRTNLTTFPEREQVLLSAAMCGDPKRRAHIDKQAASCGVACEAAAPASASPGMPASFRARMYGLLLVGMLAMVVWEQWLESLYVKRDLSVHKLSRQAETQGGGCGDMDEEPVSAV